MDGSGDVVILFESKDNHPGIRYKKKDICPCSCNKVGTQLNPYKTSNLFLS